jgi:hypothetical protein
MYASPVASRELPSARLRDMVLLPTSAFRAGQRAAILFGTVPHHLPRAFKRTKSDLTTTKDGSVSKAGSPAKALVDPPAPAIETSSPSLPFLQRPLGVAQRPNTARMTWKTEMMDQGLRMAERETLCVVILASLASILSALPGGLLMPWRLGR